MSFTPNIPADGQSLGNSKPMVRNNFNVINSSFAINHIDFNSLGAGKHKFVQMPAQGSDPGTALADIALYNKLGATAGTAATNCLFLQPQNSGTAYQVSNIAPLQGAFGYSWLPGGMLIQWGNTTIAGATTNVVFTAGGGVAFTTIYTVVAIPSQTDRKSAVTTTSTTGFTFVMENTGAGVIRWIAIGLK